MTKKCLPGISLLSLSLELKMMAHCLYCMILQSVMTAKCLSCVFVDHRSSPEKQLSEAKYDAYYKLYDKAHTDLRYKAHTDSVAATLRAFAVEDVTQLKRYAKQFLGYLHCSLRVPESVSASKLDDHHSNHDFDTGPSKVIISEMVSVSTLNYGSIKVNAFYAAVTLHEFSVDVTAKVYRDVDEF